MLYVYIIIGIILIIASYIYEYFRKINKIKKDILNSYGKKVDIKKNKTDINYASNYFKNTKDDKKFYIDDITWNDLSMDKFFLSINNTRTSIGDEFLYSIFRNISFNLDKLKCRDNLIEYFRKNSKERFDVQFILGRLGKKENANLSFYFKNPMEVPKNRIILYRTLQLLPLILLILIVFYPPAFFLLIISLVFNMWLQGRLKKYNGYRVDDYMYMIGMANAARKIYSLNLKEVNSKFPNIKENLNNVKNIKNKFINTTPAAANGEIGIYSEYMKMFFLRDVIKYEKICRTVMENTKDFEEIYKFVGMIDSMIAISSYRDAIKNYCKPVFTESKNLSFNEIYHPFIEEPVTNDGVIDRSMLITGSNASGKSTFLKTVALNAITAQSIYTVFAKEYRSNLFRVYSSMALKDSIFKKESYYMVEIKSLKRIIDAINYDIPILCFVDEILRGTNTIERIAASSEVLKYFSSNNNCICIAATHDIELTHILEGHFDNYHFQEEIKNNDIKFDYKLYKGRATTRNAIKILDLIGYDKNIVKSAEKSAEDFIKDGIWRKI
ncbi:MutS-related protein [Clostridium baratii]|uniref:MutS-related protein n=1 Tax=Clostridium baratii TaxID=1561 RepID=UPI0030D4B92A